MIAAALLLAAALAGCPGTLKDKERFLTGGGGGAGPCPDVPSGIFAQRCDGSGCHGSTQPASMLDLVSPGVAARVVGKAAVGCTGVLADPPDPAGSVIVEKLGDTPPCGAPMPLGAARLSAAEIACVRDWIAAQTASAGGAGGAGGSGGSDAGP